MTSYLLTKTSSADCQKKPLYIISISTNVRHNRKEPLREAEETRADGQYWLPSRECRRGYFIATALTCR